MIQSLRNSLPSLSLQTFSVRQVQDKWAALTPIQRRDVSIKTVALLAISLMVFTAAYQLACYCFTVKKMTRSDGVIFKGTIDAQGRLQGKGTKELPNTFKAKKEEGVFENSALIQGTREFHNGDVHEGTFQTGKLVQGTITFADKTVWKGYFEDDKLHGEGKQDLSKCTDKENTVLIREGCFVAGLLQGQGRKAFKSNETHEGRFDQGKLVEGKIKDSTGKTFEGQFVELKLQGKGRIDYPETSNFLFEEGEFEADLLQGKGKKVFRNGDVHEGTFEKGWLIKGTKEFSTGKVKICTGTFDKGKFVEGTKEFRGDNGQVHKGTFKEGNLSEGTITYPNGNFYQGTFDEKFNLQGQGTKVVNGVKYAGTFKDDQFIRGTKTDKDGNITDIGETT